MSATHHKITTEIYHTASWSVPEGGPEVEITFAYRPACGPVWAGPRAAPAEPESVEFIEARYTHDKSLLTGDWAQWAEDWLGDHEDDAAMKAWADLHPDREDPEPEALRSSLKEGV